VPPPGSIFGALFWVFFFPPDGITGHPRFIVYIIRQNKKKKKEKKRTEIEELSGMYIRCAPVAFRALPHRTDRWGTMYIQHISYIFTYICVHNPKWRRTEKNKKEMKPKKQRGTPGDLAWLRREVWMPGDRAFFFWLGIKPWIRYSAPT
jgi:hypothetical protein